MENNFCNSEEISEAIISLIQKEITFGLSKNEISGYYTKWKELFDTENTDFAITNKSIAPDFFLPEDKSLVGIDYPTWFNLSASNPQKIMILGIDPLRAKSAFDEYNINNHALIGTPYALHRKSMRERKDGNFKSYWGLIKGMLDEDYGIYLTDIFKIYFISQNIRSYNNTKFTNLKKHVDQILNKEIEIVKPQLIIVLGNKPLQLLNQPIAKLTDKIPTNLKHNNIPILPMVHLSGLAGGGRKKYIANNLSESDSTNDIDSYLEIINNFIIPNNPNKQWQKSL